MDRISRRQLVRGAAAAAGAMSLGGAPSVHAQKDEQTLRFVAQADLKILDPVWTSGYITRNHSYLVYDTLFGTDENLQVKPVLRRLDRAETMFIPKRSHRRVKPTRRWRKQGINA